jgi:hypothetical protein
VLEPLVARPWKTGGITAAVLTRKVDALTPTLLLDETDQAFKRDKEYGAAIQGVLNEGYRKRGVYSLCIPTKGGGWDFADLKVFSPKAFAGIGKLPDTIASRSIPIRLKRRTASEQVEEKYEEELWERAEPFHEALRSWAEHNLETLRWARPSVPEKLQNRTAEVWRPLFAIADLAGGAWPTGARRAALALSAGEREDVSLGVQLLADIERIFAERKADKLSSATLIEDLVAIEGSPWAEYGKNDKPLSKTGLARLLKHFEIKPGGVRLGDTTPKGYKREQFEDAFARYVPHTPRLNRNTATTGMDTGIAGFSIRNNGRDVADSKEGSNPHEQTVVAAVADENGGTGEEALLREVEELGLEEVA